MVRRVALLVVVVLAVVGVVFPGAAWASAGGPAQNGIWGFDLVAPVVARAAASSGAEHHRGNVGPGFDLPSRATLAASELGAVEGELQGTPPLGTGAASKFEFPDKVVNTDMGHAASRAVERAGFGSEAEARSALQDLGKRLEAEGLPPDAVRDTHTNSFGIADRVVVPGVGDGGAAIYQVFENARGEVVYRLRTVVVFDPGPGPAPPGGWHAPTQ